MKACKLCSLLSHYHHLLKVAIVVELVVVGDFDGGPVFFCFGFGT